MHDNFWSAPVLGRALAAAHSNLTKDAGETQGRVYDEQLDGYWLPLELEIALLLPSSLNTGAKVMSPSKEMDQGQDKNQNQDQDKEQDPPGEDTAPVHKTTCSSSDRSTTLIVSCRCVFQPRSGPSK